MKRKGAMVLISALLCLFLFRFYKEQQSEIVDLAKFTEYYEDSTEDNGGFALIDSFYRFERSYDLSKKESQVEKEKKAGQKDFQKVEKIEYVIQKGDSLVKIAKANNTSVKSIKANNPKMNPNLIPGTKLALVSEDGVFYKIRKGDTVGKLSLRYGVKQSDIYLYNEVEAKRMRIGDEIFLKSPNYNAFFKKPSKQLKDKKLRAANKKEMYVRNSGTVAKGGFGMPVTYKGVSSPFGNRFHPVLRRYILHTGVDLRARYVALRASQSGKVSYAGRMGGYGKIIIIKHANGYETRYAHLSQISTRVGEYVKKGELIGKTGNTGRTTGPHLHFEIRKNGKPLNPMKYL